MSNFDRLNANDAEPFMAAIDEVRRERDEARAEAERLRTALEAIAEYGEKAMAPHATIVDTMLQTAQAALRPSSSDALKGEQG